MSLSTLDYAIIFILGTLLAASPMSVFTASHSVYPLSFRDHIAHPARKHSAHGITFLC